MVQLRMIQHLHDRVDRTRFGVVCAKHQATNACVHQCSRTHRARFNCSKELAVSQAMVTNDRTSLAKGYHLRVRGGIVAGEILVPSTSDNGAIENNYRADWDFSGLQSSLCGAQGFFHEKLIGTVIGRRSSVVGHSDSDPQKRHFNREVVAGGLSLVRRMDALVASEEVQYRAQVVRHHRHQSRTERGEHPMCRHKSGDRDRHPAQFRSGCKERLHICILIREQQSKSSSRLVPRPSCTKIPR
jgi:hypothetical protein